MAKTKKKLSPAQKRFKTAAANVRKSGVKPFTKAFGAALKKELARLKK